MRLAILPCDASLYGPLRDPCLSGGFATLFCLSFRGLGVLLACGGRVLVCCHWCAFLCCCVAVLLWSFCCCVSVVCCVVVCVLCLCIVCSCCVCVNNKCYKDQKTNNHNKKRKANVEPIKNHNLGLAKTENKLTTGNQKPAELIKPRDQKKKRLKSQPKQKQKADPS